MATVSEHVQRLTLQRHLKSLFNELVEMMILDPEYQDFKEEYEKNPDSLRTRILAREMKDKYYKGYGDHNTPLADGVYEEAIERGKFLREYREGKLFDKIYVSRYIRTQQTHKALVEGWPELARVETVFINEIREREHGALIPYITRRIFFALNPEQRHLYEAETTYWYRYPQGESIPDVIQRTGQWLHSLRERDVLGVTHHVAILAMRANIEEITDPEKFHHIDCYHKPENGHFTIYHREEEGAPIKLVHYNGQPYSPEDLEPHE